MGARSKARKRAVDILFEADVRGEDAVTMLTERMGHPDLPPVREYTVTLVEGITANRARIDELISQYAEGWTLARMPAVDRAVLRLGLYELLWADDVDDAVAIDEAVELARTLSTDNSPRFVNGVLDRIGRIAHRLRATR
ncbi:transcription antitermination factor NusB [Actinoalloteichus sp. AHMU CJ021]|uniref:Transcription antitermination protein NusB n=1 Tax=Actinoalloteichus caeruleus DSM 43889 TaxID=1120930 RepID=A0ABT1JGY3_ACTCY|nr:transcription antitermination factor NusB [Actinoalloteichus caeruleus]AUS77561.1 transcription antitermination factor NusB [Actinoalloteichus sp. AHMU CJ021]MCP2331441.1 NusB antitermination factor [Actinoalloteichus caeruleus DSM 43889]